MDTNNKTLLILDEPGSDKTTSIIVEEKDVISRTKEFLEKISKKYKKAELNIYSPVGVVLKAADDEGNYAVAYEREKFVIVSHKGKSESEKLYGNWQEAIACARRIITGQTSPSKNARFILAQYVQENK